MYQFNLLQKEFANTILATPELILNCESLINYIDNFNSFSSFKIEIKTYRQTCWVNITMNNSVKQFIFKKRTLISHSIFYL